jgi:RNA polymerase sigma-70 factor (ECF subfamily)
LRRARRRPDPVDVAADSLDVGTGPALDDVVSDRVDIDAALAAIPADFRVAVVLRDLCDLAYPEIAEVLDLPPGTVRSRISRGRALLVAALGNPGAPPERLSSDG